MAADSGGVKVVGIGRARAAPDVAHMAFAAEYMDRTVPAAVENASAALARMRDALLDAGVANEDLRADHTSVDVSYGRHEEAQGFRARIGLSASVTDIDATGDILGRTLNAGGEAARLHGLRFSHSDPSSLLATARQSAFGDARARAQQYADLAGQSLGALVEVDETGRPTGILEATQSGDFASELSMPIERGRQEVTVVVTVRWAWA